ncbi:hypothetical protein [Acidisphaera sp. S103]|uniref:hypothetical protein n=1 Tax=Acidisphaera sp. S103 TaxID=1747223 RepID=UPI00131D3E2A|nr:hypothetical protein [Acidisphaera sp. S103]
MAPIVQDRSAEPPAPVQLIMYWIGFIWRCGFGTLLQTATSWPDAIKINRQTGAHLSETIERIRWRLWHGHVKRALDLIAKATVILDAAPEDMSSATTACKVTRLPGDLETYVSGQSDIIIGYATARRCEEPISTAIAEETV